MNTSHKTVGFVLLMTLCAALLIAVRVLAAGETLTRSAISAAGGQATANGLEARSAVGQPIAGLVVSGLGDVCAGFLCPGSGSSQGVPSTTPTASATPDASTTPDTSPTPDSSTTPDPSITPESTLTPEETLTPDNTLTPENTATPQGTTTPETTPTASATPPAGDLTSRIYLPIVRQ